MLHGSDTWPVKEKDGIRPEKNDARMVRWRCNFMPEYRVSAEELRTRLKLRSMRGCFQDR